MVAQRGSAVGGSAGHADGRGRRSRRSGAGRGRRDRRAPRRTGSRGRAVRGSAARLHGRPRRGAGAAAVGARRIRVVPVPGRRSGRIARRWTRGWASIWQRSPTSWTPRRCATAPAASSSPIPPRQWPRACPSSRVALAGDCAATLALARHGSSVLLRIAHQVVAATGLADAVVALRARRPSGVRPGRCALSRRRDRRTAARAAAGAGADAWPAIGRWSPRGWPGSTTSTWWRPRTCRDARRAARRDRCAAAARRAAIGEYWRFGWRWPRFICDWCGDR